MQIRNFLAYNKHHFVMIVQRQYRLAHRIPGNHDLDFDMRVHTLLLAEGVQLIHYILYRRIIYDLEMYIVRA